MKQIFLAILLSLMGMAASAQEFEGRFYGRSISFDVSNPAGVVTAMRQFNQSETGQNFPGNVLLNETIADGDSGITHTVNIFYSSAGGMDQTMGRPSLDGMRFLSTMRASAETMGSNVFTMDRGRGLASAPGTVTMLYVMEVTDPAAFNKAIDRVWSSKAMKEFPGGAFMGTFLADGTDPATHWSSFVAKDMATLMAGMDAFFASPAKKAYLKDSNDFRKVTRTNLSRAILAFSNDD